MTASPELLAAQDSPTIKFVSSLPRTGRANAQTDAIVKQLVIQLPDGEVGAGEEGQDPVRFLSRTQPPDGNSSARVPP